MKILIQGLCTGLVLQLAIGPVFFFIVNIAFSNNLYATLAAILAVTIVDYLYIGLSLLGIGTFLSSGKGKSILSAISAIVLILFGCAALKTGITEIIQHTDTAQSVLTPAQSFVRAFFLTIASPLTIVFLSSIFSAKAIELQLVRKDLLLFGIGAGAATFLFMTAAVIILSVIKQSIPLTMIKVLNCFVGFVLIFYGLKRLLKRPV